MGEFDKNQASGAAAAGEKKKLLVVCLLGGLLASVLGYHFLKGGPRSAEAAEAGSRGAAGRLASAQTPAQTLAALDPARDPTRGLLLGASPLSPDMLAVPRNPFKISDSLRALIIRPQPAVVKAAQPRAQPVRRVEEPHPADETLKAEDFKLAGIIRRDTQLVAIINGHFLVKGETVGNARVIDIQDNRVILRHKDWPDGPETVLSIDPDR